MTKYIRNKMIVRQKISSECNDIEPKEFVVCPKYFCFFQLGEIHTDGIDIYEHYGKISINGYLVYGWVEYHMRCKKCNHIMVFDMDWDDHICPRCNEWHHTISGNCDCEICTNRPEKPLPDFGVNDDSYPIRTLGGWEDMEAVIILD